MGDTSAFEALKKLRGCVEFKDKKMLSETQVQRTERGHDSTGYQRFG
jgi:flagellar biosynthesis regulator FlbT